MRGFKHLWLVLALVTVAGAVAAQSFAPPGTFIQTFGFSITGAQGNGPKVQLSTGATVLNDCVVFDANGNTKDSGSGCGGAGGAVLDVFGRIGHVFAQSGDYTFAELSGSLACGQTPALTGDVTTSAGSCATVLKNTGIGAGSCTSCNISIDAQGRVTTYANGTGGGGAVSVTARDSGILITPSPGTNTFTIGAQMPFDARVTTTESVGSLSISKIVTFANTSAVAVTLTSSAFVAGEGVCLLNINTGPVTVTPTSGTINTLASITLPFLASICPRFDGTNWADPTNAINTATDAITAHAGGGQGSAVLMTSSNNTVATVATAGDSVKLLPAFPGNIQIVTNAAANAMQVFGSGTDTVNGVATGTGVSQAGGVTTVYQSTVAGAWHSTLLAASGTGTVTSVVCGTGLSGGTITTTGTCSIDLTHANTWSGTQTFGTIGGYLANVLQETTTARTLAATDCGTIISTTNGSAVTVTLPNSLAKGCAVTVDQTGAGQVTFSPAAGGTLTNFHSFTKTAGQHATVSVYVESNSGTNAAWILAGDGA